MCLLAAEMMAVEQASPSELYERLAERLGRPVYQRLDAPADDDVRAALAAVRPEDVPLRSLGGSPVTAVLTRAPGNDAPMGGVKVVSEDGWFAVRPFGHRAHLQGLQLKVLKERSTSALCRRMRLGFLERLLKRGA